MFSLSPIYSARKSSNHKLFINHKISPVTNLHKTKLTQTSNTKFSKNKSLRYHPCFKKAHKDRTRWYRRPLHPLKQIVKRSTLKQLNNSLKTLHTNITFTHFIFCKTHQSHARNQKPLPESRSERVNTKISLRNISF